MPDYLLALPSDETTLASSPPVALVQALARHPTREAHRPPFTNLSIKPPPNKYANWLDPFASHGSTPSVAVGAHPCREIWRRQGPHAHVDVLEHLVETIGVRLFVCLEDCMPDTCTQQPMYMNELPEDSWDVECRTFPALDGCSFEWQTLGDCLSMLLEHMHRPNAGVAYVHCFGGHGRAGIVTACFLGVIYDLSGPDALLLAQAAHDTRPDPAWPCDKPQLSPQTQVQQRQVCALLGAVRMAREMNAARGWCTRSLVLRTAPVSNSRSESSDEELNACLAKVQKQVRMLRNDLDKR